MASPVSFVLLLIVLSVVDLCFAYNEVEPLRGCDASYSLRQCRQDMQLRGYPSQDCCQELERVPRECRCDALYMLGQSRFRERVLKFPQQCGLSPIDEQRDCGRPRRHSDDMIVEVIQPTGEHAREQHGGTCRREGYHLQACRPAVARASLPSDACCQALQKIPYACRCQAIRDDARLTSSPEYRRRAFRLPGKCGVSVPSECRRH